MEGRIIDWRRQRRFAERHPPALAKLQKKIPPNWRARASRLVATGESRVELYRD